MLLAPFLVLSATAVFIEEKLKDPVLEARALEISAEIRCLVCQNQSILDSNAELAKDLRQIVRERIALGESDEEVRGFLVDRYGDWVLLNPPFKISTVFLWLGPAVIFILGAFAMVVFLRGRNRLVEDESRTKLSTTEEAEVNRLLKSDETGQNS
nr:cytochrome c-type biogenesis protein [Sneathiella sedimenti]